MQQVYSPSTDPRGAYVKLVGQSLTALSSILRQQFDQPFIEQPSHDDRFVQK
jgi:hypothetical protein